MTQNEILLIWFLGALLLMLASVLFAVLIKSQEIIDDLIIIAGKIDRRNENDG